VSARFTFRSGARTGQVETFRKAYIGLGRHPLSDVRFDPERDLDVSARHANIVRTGGRFVLRDLGSTNGTFVNGQRIAGDVVLAHGDVISFGQHGPAVEFHIIPDGDDAPSQAARESAGRMASPRPRALTTTAARIAAEVARQTRQLRRTTKLLIVGLAGALAAFTWVQWRGAGDARALARLEAGAERLQAEMATLRDALHESQLEVAQLRAELAAARTARDASAVARLRARLDSAETRQRRLAGAAGMDYRAIAENNQDAVALLVVAFSASEIISGTAFAVDSQGTLVTNKHVLVGEDGNRRPERLAVKFSGSRQWFPGRFLGVADSADVGLVRVDISGGTPSVAGLASVPQALARGDPVAIIGYPLGEDLPMVHLGENDVVADPTLTVGTVSKVLPTLVQVDGYGAPGSSGSPIFDRAGRVVALLYGGNRESQGKIIFAVPASAMVSYLKSANLIK
jgi:S1-C subfamily serine protease